MRNAPLTTPPCRPRDETTPASAATANVSRPSKARKVELPADLWLQVASTDVDAFLRVADALPGLRRDLLQPGSLRRVLLREGYPSRLLPRVAAPGAQRDLYHRVRAHAALAAYLLPQAAPFTTSPGSFPEAGKIPSPLASLGNDLYLIRDGYAVQTRSWWLQNQEGARASVLSLAHKSPILRPLDLPRNWALMDVSPNGRWALAYKRAPAPVRPLRLFDLSRPELFACYTSFFRNVPTFTADSQALLFTDRVIDTVRINRVDLSQASLPIVRHDTALSADSPHSSIIFAPRGHSAICLNGTSVRAVHLTSPAPTTEFLDDDIDEEFKVLVWSSDEAHLRLFYPDSQRAVTFSLNHPVAQRRAFVPEDDTQLGVQDCNGEHLLTVRPQGGDDIWQLYGWNGKAASAPVTLPQGRRNHEDHSELVGFRALLPQDRDPTSSAGSVFFVDFAEANPIPLALGNTHTFKLSGAEHSDSDWLVGKSRHAQPLTYALVDTSREGRRRGQAVHLPRANHSSIHVRADGKAALVGQSGVGLFAYRLAP